MSMSRGVVLVLLIGVACGAQMSLNAQAKNGQPSGKPSLMSIARQVFADREGAAERQAVEQDSYLEALEYSQNSAALQGEGGGIGGFFRYESPLCLPQLAAQSHPEFFFLIRTCSSIQNAVSDVGFSRAGIAAAVAVPLVAIGGLALLSPLALGRKRRDLDAVEGMRVHPQRSTVFQVYNVSSLFLPIYREQGRAGCYWPSPFPRERHLHGRRPVRRVHRTVGLRVGQRRQEHLLQRLRPPVIMTTSYTYKINGSQIVSWGNVGWATTVVKIKSLPVRFSKGIFRVDLLSRIRVKLTEQNRKKNLFKTPSVVEFLFGKFGTGYFCIGG